ncbi:MAG: peptidoglycan-binding protein [Clostridia bacterium]|nr:peptidoglycan-binding protein [Clostridia bacterium]
MAKILVYNNNTGRMQTFYKGEQEAMPYNSNRTLTVAEFRGSSNSNILWTNRRTMEAWNSFRYIYGRPIFVGFAFKRPWEGGHSNLSQHYAGVAFDVAQNLDYSGRLYLRNLAYNSGIWAYVEPINLTPRWVHFDNRTTIAGYPLIRQGNRGVYVCIAQDSLNTVGFETGGLDGVFGSRTNEAVRNYQRSRGLSVDGIIGNITWNLLQEEVVGKGRMSTTID